MLGGGGRGLPSPPSFALPRSCLIALLCYLCLLLHPSGVATSSSFASLPPHSQNEHLLFSSSFESCESAGCPPPPPEYGHEAEGTTPLSPGPPYTFRKHQDSPKLQPPLHSVEINPSECDFLVTLRDGSIHLVNSGGIVRWSLEAYHATPTSAEAPPTEPSSVSPQRLLPGVDGQIFYKGEDGGLVPLPINVKDIVFHLPFFTPLFPQVYFLGKREAVVDRLDVADGRVFGGDVRGPPREGRQQRELRIGQTRWLVKAMDIKTHKERWRLDWREITPIVNLGGREAGPTDTTSPAAAEASAVAIRTDSDSPFRAKSAPTTDAIPANASNLESEKKGRRDLVEVTTLSENLTISKNLPVLSENEPLSGESGDHLLEVDSPTDLTISRAETTGAKKGDGKAYRFHFGSPIREVYSIESAQGGSSGEVYSVGSLVVKADDAGGDLSPIPGGIGGSARSRGDVWPSDASEALLSRHKQRAAARRLLPWWGDRDDAKIDAASSPFGTGKGLEAGSPGMIGGWLPVVRSDANEVVWYGGYGICPAKTMRTWLGGRGHLQQCLSSDITGLMPLEDMLEVANYPSKELIETRASRMRGAANGGRLVGSPVGFPGLELLRVLLAARDMVALLCLCALVLVIQLREHRRQRQYQRILLMTLLEQRRNIKRRSESGLRASVGVAPNTATTAGVKDDSNRVSTAALSNASNSSPLSVLVGPEDQQLTAPPPPKPMVLEPLPLIRTDVPSSQHFSHITRPPSSRKSSTLESRHHTHSQQQGPSGTNSPPSATAEASHQLSLIPKDSVLAGFLHNGRFCRTFKHVTLIGKGGFGSVYRVRHKFEPDFPEYAIKMIALHLKASENIAKRRYFREVSANKDLFSKQVVRYFTWWCEEPQFLDLPDGGRGFGRAGVPAAVIPPPADPSLKRRNASRPEKKKKKKVSAKVSGADQARRLSGVPASPPSIRLQSCCQNGLLRTTTAFRTSAAAFASLPRCSTLQRKRKAVAGAQQLKDLRYQRKRRLGTLEQDGWAPFTSDEEAESSSSSSFVADSTNLLGKGEKDFSLRIIRRQHQTRDALSSTTTPFTSGKRHHSRGTSGPLAWKRKLDRGYGTETNGASGTNGEAKADVQVDDSENEFIVFEDSTRSESPLKCATNGTGHSVKAGDAGTPAAPCLSLGQATSAAPRNDRSPRTSRAKMKGRQGGGRNNGDKEKNGSGTSEQMYTVILLLQTELVSGTSLRQWLDRPDRSSKPDQLVADFKHFHSAQGTPEGSSHRNIPAALALFRQLIKGLRDIHTHGIVHRDLKPENIFVNKVTLALKIGDFGLVRFVQAKSLATDAVIANAGSAGPSNPAMRKYLRSDLADCAEAVAGDPSSETPSTEQTGDNLVSLRRMDSVDSVKGSIIGTPGYTAPEGGALCTEKADIYSAALVFLELLCPRFETLMERFQTLENFRLKQQVPSHLRSKYMRPWCKLVRRMGAHNPKERPSAGVIYRYIKMGLRTKIDVDESTKDQFSTNVTTARS